MFSITLGLCRSINKLMPVFRRVFLASLGEGATWQRHFVDLLARFTQAYTLRIEKPG